MRLHHIAYVTADVEQKADSLCGQLGFTRMAEAVIDETQGVRILFLDMGPGPKLELLEPLDESSPVQKHLDKGGGLYHMCYEVDDLEETLKQVQKDGRAIIVKEPSEAPAIKNKRVAFVVTSDKDLIEFVESENK